MAPLVLAGSESVPRLTDASDRSLLASMPAKKDGGADEFPLRSPWSPPGRATSYGLLSRGAILRVARARGRSVTASGISVGNRPNKKPRGRGTTTVALPVNTQSDESAY